MTAPLHLGHDIFLLMVSLSRVKDKKRVTLLFTEAMSRLFENLEFQFSFDDQPCTVHTLDLLTSQGLYGRISIKGAWDSLSPASVALIENASTMLSLVLENILQAEELAAEKGQLESEVARRTAELAQKNHELQRHIQEKEEITAALLDSERRYRSIVETAQDGFWRVDGQGKILEVNDAYCGMVGYNREDLLSMSIADLDVFETQEQVSEHLKKVVSEGYDHFETAHRRKDGSSVRIEVAVQFLPGPPAVLFTFLRDITEKKRAEESLKDSEETYRALVASLPDIVMRFNKDGRHLFVSDNVTNVVAIPKERFLGKTHRELGFSESLCRLWEDGIQRVFESRSPLES